MIGALVSGIAGGSSKGGERRRTLKTCKAAVGWREVDLTSANVGLPRAKVANSATFDR